ncbi:hypothetical protein HPP92_027804 [Vanilla planifolia]|uniref:Uncharacterized protein n=1 Tax=Vanilla planifolia TaxID=51239 RepID=A0A835PAK7_VANPL|nr:hypothetical protein HPP92_027804 [Vanilla planifolia]KAG0448576.1 hypothetical protein HPP92_027746 [Vanilla planifolia]
MSYLRLPNYVSQEKYYGRASQQTSLTKHDKTTQFCRGGEGGGSGDSSRDLGLSPKLAFAVPKCGASCQGPKQFTTLKVGIIDEDEEELEILLNSKMIMEEKISIDEKYIERRKEEK